MVSMQRNIFGLPKKGIMPSTCCILASLWSARPKINRLCQPSYLNWTEYSIQQLQLKQECLDQIKQNLKTHIRSDAIWFTNRLSYECDQIPAHWVGWTMMNKETWHSARNICDTQASAGSKGSAKDEKQRLADTRVKIQSKGNKSCPHSTVTVSAIICTNQFLLRILNNYLWSLILFCASGHCSFSLILWEPQRK